MQKYSEIAPVSFVIKQ